VATLSCSPHDNGKMLWTRRNDATRHSRLHLAPRATPRRFRVYFQFAKVREIGARVAAIRQRCSCAVNARQSRTDKQLIQVVSIRRQHDCIITRKIAAAQREPPACLNRERFCERLLREFACLASNFNRCIRANSEIRGLLSDAVCVNARSSSSVSTK
jgi:hypothetical protein